MCLTTVAALAGLPGGSLAATQAPAQPSPLDTLRAALERSRTSGDSTAMAEALNGVGLQFWNAAEFDSAVAYLDHARAVWTRLDDSAGLGRVYNNLGVTYYQWGHLGSALESHLRSIAIRRALGDARGTALALTNAGRTLKDMPLPDRAAAVLGEATEESDRSGDAFVRGYARYNLGLLRIGQGDAEGARAAFDESARIYREGGPSLTPSQSADGVGMNRVGMASVLLATGDARGAIALLEEPLGSAGESAVSVRQADALIVLGKAYLSTGTPTQAIRAFERALQLSREAGQRSREMDALRALSDSYERLGDVRTALRYARLHRTLSDVAAGERGAIEALAVEGRLAAEREAAENALLREQGRARESRLARQHLAFWLGGPLLLVSVALVGVLVAFNRRLRERERLLAVTNQELRVALSEVRTLEGLIPICARCKKVRDEGGYWESVESYITSRSDALFSHGICDDCGKDLYGPDWEAGPAEAVTARGMGTAPSLMPAPDGPPRSR